MYLVFITIILLLSSFNNILANTSNPENISPTENFKILLKACDQQIQANNFKAALKHLHLAEKLINKNKSTDSSVTPISVNNFNLARLQEIFALVYFKQNRLWDAKTSIDFALDLYQDAGSKKNIYSASLLKGKIQLANAEYSLAEKQFLQIIENTGKNNLAQLHLESMSQLAIVAAKKGDHKKANNLLTKGLILQKEICGAKDNKALLSSSNEEQTEIFEKIYSSFSLKNKKALVKLQQSKWLNAWLFLLAFFFAGFAFLFGKKLRKKDRSLIDLKQRNVLLKGENKAVHLQKKALGKIAQQMQSNQSRSMEVKEILHEKNLILNKKLKQTEQKIQMLDLTKNSKLSIPINKIGKTISNNKNTNAHQKSDSLATNLQVDLNELFHQLNKKYTADISFNKLPSIEGDHKLVYHFFKLIIQKSIIAKRENHHPNILIEFEEKNNTIFIKMLNNDSGLNSNSHASIFKAYSSLMNDLGEANVLEKIWLESQAGHGTSFYFHLPLAKELTPVSNDFFTGESLEQ